MQTFTKVVTEKELLFTLIASHLNICPKVLSYQGEIMIIQKYPRVLIDEPSWSKYQMKIVNLVQQLHAIGILHADISEENIVLNPITQEVRLIDFGMSRWIEDIQTHELNEYYSYREELNSTAELLQAEINEVA